MKNNHKKVIPVLQTITQLQKEQLISILFEVARTQPAVLLTALKTLMINPLEETVREIVKRSGKIAGIKYYRDITNSTLRDAKDAVDRIVDRRP